MVKTQDFQDLKADGTCSGHCVLKVKKMKPTSCATWRFFRKILISHRGVFNFFYGTVMLNNVVYIFSMPVPVAVRSKA